MAFESPRALGRWHWASQCLCGVGMLGQASHSGGTVAAKDVVQWLICNDPDTTDVEDPGNYRGITLLSVVGKVFCKNSQ